MAWSYDNTLPTEKDQIRLLVGDIIAADPQLDDNEVQFFADQFSVKIAAAEVAMVLSAKYAREADKWVGDLKILASQRSRTYAELAKRLREQAATIEGGTQGQGLYAGGISLSDKAQHEANVDANLATFRMGMHDNPDTE